MGELNFDGRPNNTAGYYTYFVADDVWGWSDGMYGSTATSPEPCRRPPISC